MKLARITCLWMLCWIQACCAFATTGTSPLPKAEWPPLLLLTEHSPPGEFLDAEGQVTGATVSLIRQLMRNMNEQGDIRLLSWARGLEIAKSQPNIALFETIRNTQRENLFKWVGPLKHYRISLYARSDRVTAGQTMPQLAQKHVACANRGSVYANLLQEHGFIPGNNLVLTVSEDRCARMMLQKRVDLAPFNQHTMQKFTDELTNQPFSLLPAIVLTDVKLFIAFSNNVPDLRIQRWQTALENSYLDGTMRKIYSGTYSEELISRLEQFARQQDN